MDLKITDDALKAALSEAILVSIGSDGQKALVQEAINGLVQKQAWKGQYGRTEERPSKVEELFGNAVARIAQEVINDLVKDDPEIRAAVEKISRDTIMAVLSSTEFAGAMSESLAKQIRGY